MRASTALGVILVFIAALAAIVWGLFSQTFFAGGIAVADFGWHVFAFSSGLLLLASPSLLPFTLAIIPLAGSRRAGRAVVLTFAFSIGTLLILTAFGFFAGLIGYIGYDVFAFRMETLSSWGMLLLGAIAYILALGEVDILQIVRGVGGEKIARLLSRPPGVFGALMLGILLASINIHPATLLLLADTVLRGDPIYGASLLLIHALGRIIPLLIVLTLAALKLNVSDWINEGKERARATLGWLLIGVSGLLLNIGLYAWLRWLGVDGGILQLFTHRWVIALLWLTPLWVLYYTESRRVYGNQFYELRSIERALDRTERDRRSLEHALHFPESENGRHIIALEREIDALEKRRRIAESGIRHAAHDGIRGAVAERLEERLLFMRFGFTIVCSLLIVTVLALFVI